MASFFGKVDMKVAQQARYSKFDLSCNHATTMDFYNLRPVYIKECVPNEKIKINMRTFSRLSPLIEPMMGSARFINRAFFVPMRTIMEGWTDFIEDTPHMYAGDSVPSIINRVNSVTNTALIDMFFENSYDVASQNWTAFALCASGEFDTPDFVDSAGVKYKLTHRGKYYLNVLNSLGYKLSFNLGSGGDDSTEMSVLPLLAFARVFNDWYANTQYSNMQLPRKYFVGKYRVFTFQDIYDILNSTWRVCYQADFFTQAWDNPVSPSNNNSSTISMADSSTSNLQNYSSKVQTNPSNTPSTTNTPVITQNGQNIQSSRIYTISQQVLDQVKHVTDYVKRKQLSGVREIDRYMAEFGVQLSDAKVNRSMYIGKNEVPVQISDVMQTSPNVDAGSSDSNGLGNYAGKGIAYGQDQFVNFETDEFGYLIILSYIEPNVSYVDGRPRMLQHLSRFHFFTPEFDNLGVQAIRVDEISAGQMDYSADSIGRDLGNPDDIFGFAPRYAEYKQSTNQDNITGDFRLASKNTSLDGWLLYRDLRPSVALSGVTGGNKLVHSLNFTLADGNLFNNIFMSRNSNNDPLGFFDHFFVMFRFDVDSWQKAMPLYETYDFDSEGKEYQADLNGFQITD